MSERPQTDLLERLERYGAVLDDARIGYERTTPVAELVPRPRVRVSRTRGIVAGAAIAAVVAATVAIALGTRHATRTTRAGVTPTSTAIKADTSWARAILSVDGMTLQIGVANGPPPCAAQFVHDVVETRRSVTVAVRGLAKPTTTASGLCYPMLIEQQISIRLHAPLGNRLLYDGIDPQPRPVSWLADVVTPTVLPDGVTIATLNRTPGRGPLDWSQTAQVSSGPGWDFFIDQAPAGSFVAPTTAPGTVVATTTVHGHAAKIYEYFNSTGREIHWIEGGLDITVRAELHTVNMKPPQSFANPEVAFIDAELQNVADGIVVPSTVTSTAANSAHSLQLPHAVMAWLASYTANSPYGHASSADWVLTTHEAAMAMYGGDAVPGGGDAVYVFDVHGRFVWNHSCPPGASPEACVSRGESEVFTLDPKRLQILDFTVGNAVDLSRFGPVGHVSLH